MIKVFGRGVRGDLPKDTVERMKGEVAEADATPLVRAFAVWVLDGLDTDQCLRLAHDMDSDMSRMTAGWYRGRAYRLLRKLFNGRELEFGLDPPVREVKKDLSTTELAELMAMPVSTLRVKLRQANELGLPKPVKLLGRTLGARGYIFPVDVAQAWLDAWLSGEL